MKVLVDTNVLFSALIYPDSVPAKALFKTLNEYDAVLCDKNISEFKEVLQRKAPQFLPDAEVLLAEMSYDLIPSVSHAEKLIRDAKDQPILNAAILYGVDVIITGDKDFLSLKIDRPKCISASEFLELY